MTVSGCASRSSRGTYLPEVCGSELADAGKGRLRVALSPDVFATELQLPTAQPPAGECRQTAVDRALVPVSRVGVGKDQLDLYLETQRALFASGPAPHLVCWADPDAVREELRVRAQASAVLRVLQTAPGLVDRLGFGSFGTSDLFMRGSMARRVLAAVDRLRQRYRAGSEPDLRGLLRRCRQAAAEVCLEQPEDDGPLRRFGCTWRYESGELCNVLFARPRVPGVRQAVAKLRGRGRLAHRELGRFDARKQSLSDWLDSQLASAPVTAISTDGAREGATCFGAAVDLATVLLGDAGATDDASVARYNLARYLYNALPESILLSASAERLATNWSRLPISGRWRRKIKRTRQHPFSDTQFRDELARRDQELCQAIEYLCSDPEVDADRVHAILGGSAAKGRIGCGSDVDLYVEADARTERRIKRGRVGSKCAKDDLHFSAFHAVLDQETSYGPFMRLGTLSELRGRADILTCAVREAVQRYGACFDAEGLHLQFSAKVAPEREVDEVHERLHGLATWLEKQRCDASEIAAISANPEDLDPILMRVLGPDEFVWLGQQAEGFSCDSGIARLAAAVAAASLGRGARA